MLSPENQRVGPLTTIIDWYQNLPKRAREGMSLANLHDLSKSLDAARAESQSELLDMLAAAYEQGCRDVHENYQECRDPEFGEAAHDYALSAIASAEGLPSRLEKYGLQTNGEGICADPQAVQPMRGENLSGEGA